MTRSATWLQRQWWQSPPTTAARLLQPLSLLYALCASLHRWSYACGLRRPWRAPVPVVVVGNLIVGGAGKTPTVMALVALLRSAGWQPGIVSRGYGRVETTPVDVEPLMPAARCGDEPLLMHLSTGAPVSVASDRAAAARRLLQRHPEVDIVIADDGLQHHGLARDVEVIVFDQRGAGNGRLLPAGPLRAPLPRRLGARTLVLFNAPAPSVALPGALAERSVGSIRTLAAWWQGGLEALPLHELQGRPLLAVAGIAEPERFFSMLEAGGLQIQRCPQPDHARYERLPWPQGTPDVLVTEKDAVKLPPERVLPPTRVWVVTLDFRLPADFGLALNQALPTPPRAASRDHL